MTSLEDAERHDPRARICLVGPNRQLVSGATYYLHGLARRISQRMALSIVYLGRLRPVHVDERHSHVGVPGDELGLPDGVAAFDAVDWTVLPSLPRAMRFIRRQRPEVIVLVCWTRWTIHTYLALAAYGRSLGIPVVVDLHDAAHWRRRPYHRELAVDQALTRLMHLADRVIVHDDSDRGVALGRFGLSASRVVQVAQTSTAPSKRPARETSTFLYFGGIDHFKGISDLVRAFDCFSSSVIDGLRLVIAGPVYGDFPIHELVASCRHRGRITLDTRWIPEDEVPALFEAADVVVLPYRTHWSAGPALTAMDMGKPIVLTRVEAFAPEANGYAKRILAEEGNVASLLVALERAATLASDRIDPHRDWDVLEEQYFDVLTSVAESKNRHDPARPRWGRVSCASCIMSASESDWRTPLSLADAFAKDGYCIIPGALDAAEVARLRQDVNAALDIAGIPLGSGMVVPNAAVEAEPVSWLFQHQRLLDGVRQVLGEPAPAFTMEAGVHRNYIVGVWHKDTGEQVMDGGYFARDNIGSDDCRVVKVGVYLQDHSDGTGLCVRPGSHRTASLAEGDEVPLRTGPGDAVLFDVRITHRGQRASTGDRLVWAATRALPAGRRARSLERARRTLLKTVRRPDRMAVFFAFGIPGPDTEMFTLRNLYRQQQQHPRQSTGRLVPGLAEALSAHGVQLIDISPERVAASAAPSPAR